ncbi:mannose-1-phosphate guanylyltransferase [Gillisia mitskevichiae]|uniref:mannose-1-phosphate guanylyltransferase n=1 Tax=Gillisia mitskevichiae TaxID=270921 RepID=A0A495P4L7_9FLAO|nr:mannose-1-phosphate guanylyltransferase [Gillisia mitskevichiae]RKS44916.1 mannose-1-phosphate guanylyltransferase [Gillisia mitskevichiae]
MIIYNQDYYAVIMAGGVGSRFWPLSTAKYPKQFHDMLGLGETLLQSTFNRLTKVVPYENILILSNEVYNDIIKEQLPKITQEQIILEPAMRNTAPCILLAAMKINKKNPNAVMVVAPSDHFINDEDAFAADINLAFKAAYKENILVTLGIKPTFPNTGYGYIKYGKEEGMNLQKVEIFTEKPTLRNAKKYLEDGNYVWNAGIFIWKASFIADSFKTLLPEMFNLFDVGKEYLNTSKEEKFVKDTYPEAQNISIDYAIMEKSDSVYVIPASFKWSDLGTWGSLHEELPKDESDNAVVNAQLMHQDAKGNIIYTHNPKVVFIDGLKDFIIVDDKDVLMIVPKEKEQDIKEIRNKVMKKFDENLG